LVPVVKSKRVGGPDGGTHKVVVVLVLVVVVVAAGHSPTRGLHTNVSLSVLTGRDAFGLSSSERRGEA
jgi:hypothetical protein